MKVALVYDRVNKIGGAERILEALHQIWPEAPLYSAVYDQKKAGWAKNFAIKTSFLQKFPLAKNHHELYPWLTPLAFESFSFDGYDLVISVTSAEAKGIITKPETFHLCYCLTPTRYLWVQEKTYLENPGFGFLNPLARLTFKLNKSWLKKWDQVAASRPDSYLSISKLVKKRLKKYYHQDSQVIYPPVDTKKSQISNRKTQNLNKPYFLLVSRLVAYKRVDLAIEAFNKMNLELKIVGTGSLERDLKRKAKKNISFLGQLTDAELFGYYHHCRALVMPQEEDFGLVALEAQTCGRPVISYKASGASEVIEEGKTGEFFLKQDADSLIKVIKNFKEDKYQPTDCQKNAQKYSLENFKTKIKKFIKSKQKERDLWKKSI